MTVATIAQRSTGIDRVGELFGWSAERVEAFFRDKVTPTERLRD